MRAPTVWPLAMPGWASTSRSRPRSYAAATRTTTTGTGACRTTCSATLPMNNCDMPRRPWLPTTMRSAPISRAVAGMISRACPVRTIRRVTSAAPCAVASSVARASCSTCATASGGTGAGNTAGPLSGIHVDARSTTWSSVTSAPNALAAAWAHSSARAAVSEKSVATRMRRTEAGLITASLAQKSPGSTDTPTGSRAAVRPNFRLFLSHRVEIESHVRDRRQDRVVVPTSDPRSHHHERRGLGFEDRGSVLVRHPRELPVHGGAPERVGGDTPFLDELIDVRIFIPVAPWIGPVAREERLREVVGVGVVGRPCRGVHRALVLRGKLQERGPLDASRREMELRVQGVDRILQDLRGDLSRRVAGVVQYRQRNACVPHLAAPRRLELRGSLLLVERVLGQRRIVPEEALNDRTVRLQRLTPVRVAEKGAVVERVGEGAPHVDVREEVGRDPAAVELSAAHVRVARGVDLLVEVERLQQQRWEAVLHRDAGHAGDLGLVRPVHRDHVRVAALELQPPCRKVCDRPDQ